MAERSSEVPLVSNPNHPGPKSCNFEHLRERALGFFPDPYPSLSVPPFTPMATSSDFVIRLWESFLRHSRFSDHIVLHLHVPYCVRKCTYCDCSSEPLRSLKELRDYLQGAISEMDSFAPLFQATTFRRLYVGGGTPNILPAAALSALLDAVNRRFRFADGVVRCIEFSPELTTREKLRAARQAGINRISLGVQTLDTAILNRVGRHRARREIAREAFDLVREVGFEEVNVDLIFGLDGETPESFQSSLEEVLDWGPDTITVQLLHDCAVTQVIGSSLRRQELEDQFVASVERWISETTSVHNDYRCVIRPATAIFIHRKFHRRWDEWLDFYSYRDRVTFSTLGLGVYAHSKMHGLAGYQRQSKTSLPYVYQSYSEELESAMDMACLLTSDGSFDLKEIESRYGGISERLHRILARLVEEGKLYASGSVFTAKPGPVNPLLRTVYHIALECLPEEQRSRLVLSNVLPTLEKQ